MSRRLVISILVMLILGILGGTVVLLIQRLRSGDEVADSTGSSGTLTPADSGRPTIVNPANDDDSDGLINADEALWGTDPQNADTDGDGFQDGEEVTARHNPTIAGPNDTLPEDFSPERDLQPLPDAPLQVDQFFADNLDLTGGSKNYTQEYDQQVADDAKDVTSLVSYVQQQPIITKLPTVQGDAIRQTSESPAALTTYLSVVGDLGVLSNKNLFNEALNDLVQSQDSSDMRSLVVQVRLYQTSLFETPVPPSALNLHKLLLGYSELVAATLDQIAQLNEDPLKSLLALRQLDEIDRQYYPLINQELGRLRR